MNRRRQDGMYSKIIRTAIDKKPLMTHLQEKARMKKTKHNSTIEPLNPMQKAQASKKTEKQSSCRCMRTAIRNQTVCILVGMMLIPAVHTGRYCFLLKTIF